MVVVAASSLNQARVIYDHTAAFLEAKHGPLTRGNGFRSVNSPNMVAIEHLETGAQMRAIAADPARAHGLSPSLVIADEPAQWPRAYADRLWAALVTSLGKQPGSRAIVLGIRPVRGAGHFFGELLAGGADYVQDHSAPADTDPEDKGRARSPEGLGDCLANSIRQQVFLGADELAMIRGKRRPSIPRWRV